MVKKNKSDWTTEVNTLLPDNTTGQITAADIRTVLFDLFDSIELPYTTYRTSGDLATDTIVAPSLPVGAYIFVLEDGNYFVYKKVSTQPNNANYVVGSDGSYYKEIFSLNNELSSLATQINALSNKINSISSGVDLISKTDIASGTQELVISGLDWTQYARYDLTLSGVNIDLAGALFIEYSSDGVTYNTTSNVKTGLRETWMSGGGAGSGGSTQTYGQLTIDSCKASRPLTGTLSIHASDINGLNCILTGDFLYRRNSDATDTISRPSIYFNNSSSIQSFRLTAFDTNPNDVNGTQRAFTGGSIMVYGYRR